MPAGRWRNYTTNTLVQAGANASMHTAQMNTWNGGALCDTGPYGSIARFGGGQHGTGNIYAGGVLIEDIDERKMKYMCRPRALHHQSEPTDWWRRYLSDLYQAESHTYNCVQPLLKGWNPNLPNGAVVGVEKRGCTFGFDLTKEFDSHFKLNPDDVFYHRGNTVGTSPPGLDPPAYPTNIDDSATCGTDYRRKGWWSVPRHPMSSPKGRYSLYFTAAKDGHVVEYPNPSLVGYWANITCMPDEDILIWLGSFSTDSPSDTRPQIIVLDPPDAGSRIHRVNYRPNADPQQHSALYPKTPTGVPFRVGYMGMVWCSHPKVKKFVGIDHLAVVANVDGKAVPPGSAIRIWTLTPPPVGQRFSPTAMWVWEEQIVQSGDGSAIHVRTDPGTVNGVWGACRYVAMVNAGTGQEDGQFFFTNAMNQPAKTFRLAEMT